VGIIRLSTRDGVGCAAGDVTCWSNKTAKKRDVVFKAVDGSNGQAISGLTVRLNRYFSEESYILMG
jgi:hypothetical protein